MNLLGMTYQELVDEFGRRYGRGGYHAAPLYRAFYRCTDFTPHRLPAFARSPRFLGQICNELDLSRLMVVRREAQDGVTKIGFRLADGLEIETVIIPMATHATVCVSSQAGCRMGCRFCRTGQTGLQRSLTAAEIVAQVHTVRVHMGIAVRNVVFMGMGEPLDNFDQVVHAIEIMEDQRGLDIAKSHITLSTVGLPHKIDQLGELKWNRLRLALSLNAPSDSIRNQLMPINKRYPMQMLRTALQRYPLGRGGAVFMEYVLIRGVNDRLQHARELARYTQGLPVKLNLIAYNPGGHSPFEAPTRQDINRFHRALVDLDLFVRVRSSKGAGIRAACGQLGGTPMPVK